MIYDQIPISPKLSLWIANPSNWEELAYTINNESVFLTYDPSAKVAMTPQLQAELKAFL